MKQKKSIVKGVKKPKRIKPVEAKVEAPIASIERPKIIVDNAEVLKVLEESKDAKLCQMSDGTTKWCEAWRFN